MKCSVCEEPTKKDAEGAIAITCKCGKKHIVCPICVAAIMEAGIGTHAFGCSCGIDWGNLTGGVVEHKENSDGASG